MCLRNRPFLLARIRNDSWVFFIDIYGILSSLVCTRPTGFYLLTLKRCFEQRFFGSSGRSMQVLDGLFYCRIISGPVQKEKSTIH